jgi:hypothetical protein
MDSVTPHRGGLMKSLMSLWSRLAEESASQCCTSALRDIKTVEERVEHEGLSFLTITLPSLGKAIQKWLDQGEVGIHPAFSRKRRGRSPSFLEGFLNRVFDRSSGLLLDKPCIDSIIALRQLTLMFGKMELPCSPARQLNAVQNYVKCEQDVRQFDRELSERDLLEFTNMSNLLFQGIFTRIDRDIYYDEITPKHGPGSVADGLSSNGKFNQLTWTSRLSEIFNPGEYILPNFRYNQELDNLDILEPGSEIPVKVTLVPKTLKTPRVIAMEPTCMQYMQQAVLMAFLRHFYRDNFLSKVIGFDDQEPNQLLARQGSIDNRTATLDMSDASDRVSNQLVRAMLSRWPFLSAAVDSTRSRRAVLPGNGEEIRLAKFASMGSALCFPFEAMVFTTLIFLGIQRSLNTSLNRKTIKSFSDSVRVYGDDLIVPVDHVLSVVRTLEHFGAQVGADKSFWTGRFRESCGREYFNGNDVSIVRFRQGFPTQRQDATGVISLVSFRNLLYMRGYWQTCKWLDEEIRKILKYFPDVLPTSPVLGRVSSLGYQAERLHPSLHSPLVKGYVVQAEAPPDALEGYGALVKCFHMLERRSERVLPKVGTPKGVNHPATSLADDENNRLIITRGGLPPIASSNVDHLERSGRPKCVGMKLGWRLPY